MLLYLSCLLVLSAKFSSSQLWEKNGNCPLTCTCQLQHLTETAIYRFMRSDKKTQNSEETPNSAEFNDVFYPIEPNIEFEEKPVVRSAICILRAEIEPLQLLERLPKDIEALTIIQGYDTGSKTIKFSDMDGFENLLSLELLGPNFLTKLTDSRLICEIDKPLPKIKYLNLESILIKNSKQQIQNFVKEFTDDVLTFEYVQKFDSNSHPLTMMQKGTDEEVLPYDRYKEQDDDHKVPLFIGFKGLFLLRITNCELNNVHWAMFDGLGNLEYLILDKNNLRFIPPFAFYGTPNLKTLSLAHNNLLDIQITDLAGLLELEYLDLSFNNFTQLSELSFPPFPKLKLADFANNPITMIFPNTFEVMNTTDSLIIGSDDVHLSLMTNSFMGLNMLMALTLNNLNIKLLKRDLFVGMPNLNELTLTGNITEIEYDTFLEVYKLKRLILSKCGIQNVSMDAFIGLGALELLDLSRNSLEHLPPGVFDHLINLKELYLNNNKFQRLPRDVFSKMHVKLIRLNENPWHCSCDMSEWKPMIVNRIKQKVIKPCDLAAHDKGISCVSENHDSRFMYKYVYENRVAPKCSAPRQYVNWSVFHVMRRLLKCPEYKPKIKKIFKNDRTVYASSKSETEQDPITENNVKTPTLRYQSDDNETKNDRNIQDNDLNVLYPQVLNYPPKNNDSIPIGEMRRKKFFKNKTLRKIKKNKVNHQSLMDNMI